mmetsp:Transcript_24742/g.71457  ORF Transcript_24742/g.71457 Transcript_24742/m.71457 type:complete len:271 (+) Transcript_24742:624-1436(+)
MLRGLGLSLLTGKNILKHLGCGGTAANLAQLLGFVTTSGTTRTVHVQSVSVGPLKPGRPGIGIATAEGVVVADDNEGATSSSEGHVHSAPVGYEADGTIVVGTDGTEDHGLLLTTLETIGRTNLDEWRATLTQKLARKTTDKTHLSGVRSYHGNLRWRTAALNQSTDGITGGGGLSFVELGNTIVRLEAMGNGDEGNGKLLARPGEARQRTTLGRRHTIQELATIEEVGTEHGNGWMHTILRIQHEGWDTAGNHSGKQRNAQTFLLGPGR